MSRRFEDTCKKGMDLLNQAWGELDLAHMIVCRDLLSAQIRATMKCRKRKDRERSQGS